MISLSPVTTQVHNDLLLTGHRCAEQLDRYGFQEHNAFHCPPRGVAAALMQRHEQRGTAAGGGGAQGGVPAP